ncbi:MAG: molybdate ABC transporter substrate-binding protein [Pseudomonadota bacterium]
MKLTRRACLAGALSMPLAARARGRLLIFAAASLAGALDAALSGALRLPPASVSYAGSATLARQILAGAPASLFLSAHPAWMDVLEDRGALTPGSRRDLLGNRLVIVAPTSEARPLALRQDALINRLKSGPLAMGLTKAVPAGIYGAEALQNLGLWAGLQGRVAQSDNVRGALALVARGEAPLGVVYATDALAEPRVSVVAEFPADSHQPIVYPAALIGAADPDAAAVLDYLAGPSAMDVFRAHGFSDAWGP